MKSQHRNYSGKMDSHICQGYGKVCGSRTLKSSKIPRRVNTIQAQFLIDYGAASAAVRYLRYQRSELLIMCDMVVIQTHKG
jgi:hypothetical protein